MTERGRQGGAARAGKGGKAPPPKAPPSECPPHAHVVVEKDPDEGGTIRRCICDEGYYGDPNVPEGSCEQAEGSCPPLSVYDAMAMGCACIAGQQQAWPHTANRRRTHLQESASRNSD